MRCTDGMLSDLETAPEQLRRVIVQNSEKNAQIQAFYRSDAREQKKEDGKNSQKI